MFELITAIILRILSNPFGNVFQKQLSQEGVSSLVINFMTYFLLTLFCFSLIPFGFVSGLSTVFWKYAFIGGLFGALGNSCLIKAIQKGELSVLGPINSYKSVVGIVFGYFLLKETPSFQGLLGVLFIIMGSYFVFDTLDEKFSLKLLLRKDILFRVLALVFTATEAIFIKKVIIESSVIASFMVWCWFGCLFALLLLLLFGLPKLKQIKTSDMPKYLSITGCMGVMQSTTNFVFQRMNVGYALALFQLSILVSVFFGYKFFDEKNIRKKLVGASIMIFGSIIIIMS